MTKEIHEMNSNAIDFVAELIDYIFTYPDDDYMTMECLCRKLHKYGLIDKQDGEYIVVTPQTEKTCDNCGTPREKCVYCIEEDRMWTPQTDCDGCKYEHYGASYHCDECCRRWEDGYTPQTDCAWMYDSRRDYEYDKALDEWKDFEEFDDGEDETDTTDK